MNRLRFDHYVTEPDQLRPRAELWGPAAEFGSDPRVDVNLSPSPPLAEPDTCSICCWPKTLFVASVCGWPIYECISCRGGFVWPQPPVETIQRLYQEDYWAVHLFFFGRRSLNVLFFRSGLEGFNVDSNSKHYKKRRACGLFA
jgi:hypothetical protein